MNTKVVAGLGALAIAACLVPAVRAQQTPEVKGKAANLPLYL